MELIVRIKSVCPTVVMISHNMDEIAAYCNRIAVLGHGKLIGVFTPKELFGSRELLEKSDVNLPLVTEIASRLNAAGVDIDPSILTESELTEAVLKAGGYA